MTADGLVNTKKSADPLGLPRGYRCVEEWNTEVMI
jgi:hypothetical protein